VEAIGETLMLPARSGLHLHRSIFISAAYRAANFDRKDFAGFARSSAEI
jgi:hypothetical protein